MGRPRGSLNKVTAILKAAVAESFEQLGGADYLVWLGREHPRAYVTLLAKCIPSHLRAELEVNEPPSIKILDYTGRSGDVVREIPAAMPESPEGQVSHQTPGLETGLQGFAPNGLHK